MASNVNRNITDFFKPFAQPRVKHISVSEGRSASEPDQNATISDQRQNRDIATPSSPPSGAPSLLGNSFHANETRNKAATESTLTPPVSSDPPTPTPHAQDPPTRSVRELSPLSSLSSLSSPEPSAAPSPPPTLPRNPDPAPAMNVTSSSFLSNLPISSQSSSKRVIRAGMLAVTNSDSDSIDADSDPLDDIDELIRRKRLKMTPSASKSETPLRSSPPGRELRSSTRRDKPSIVKSKPAQPPRKTYKFSLASLVAAKAKDAAADRKIKQYQEEYQQDLDESARLELQLKEASNLNAEEFADRLQPNDDDDDDDVDTRERFVRAIKRNDLLERDFQYHFFRLASPAAHKPLPFPPSAVSDRSWTSLLQDADSREEAIRSGFAADMARISALPDEITEWMLSEVLHDLETDLAHGCICTLENSFKNTPFTTERMRRQLLRRAGREDLEPDLFSDQSHMPPPAYQRPHAEEIPLNVTWSCLLLARIADRLGTAERRSWLTPLMLLLMDPKLDQHLDIQAALRVCISSLLDADSSPSVFTSTVEYVGQRILVHLPNPVLVNRLLRLLPSNTSASHAFKRRLGLASFMKSKTHLGNELDSISTMAEVTSYLHRNGRFKIKEDTDFNILGARFGILDVAVGAGFSDFEFCGNEVTVKADSPVTADMVTSGPPRSDREIEFNSAIDSLVAELRQIAFNIRDSGATHMRRTECKTAIERLSYRLDYSARTKPKPKKGLFGAAAGASDVIRNFVGRGRQDVDMNGTNV